ncbi:hypothetical protein BJ508DRAFT_305385 [Ascobolus immersus RN42]|uniref:Uncharacterized protein n=1 Tax=Ascobolus immersus RN42 TaxID=1160509 RepID=A0A3N4IF17_ASCIM|nr:hypothetical protein BJ508DRAFT_305385 [Ascobolus immersus RN42]
MLRFFGDFGNHIKTPSSETVSTPVLGPDSRVEMSPAAKNTQNQCTASLSVPVNTSPSHRNAYYSDVHLVNREISKLDFQIFQLTHAINYINSKKLTTLPHLSTTSISNDDPTTTHSQPREKRRRRRRTRKNRNPVSEVGEECECNPLACLDDYQPEQTHHESINLPVRTGREPTAIPGSNNLNSTPPTTSSSIGRIKELLQGLSTASQSTRKTNTSSQTPNAAATKTAIDLATACNHQKCEHSGVSRVGIVLPVLVPFQGTVFIKDLLGAQLLQGSIRMMRVGSKFTSQPAMFFGVQDAGWPLVGEHTLLRKLLLAGHEINCSVSWEEISTRKGESSVSAVGEVSWTANRSEPEKCIPKRD